MRCPSSPPRLTVMLPLQISTPPLNSALMPSSASA
eukprot:CAMPEP_0177793774 /NCGR_PEP_ID=MMETSP0491_2-20121128/25261_1 /TAXON_ID=63592 /ORGANISM="Tetraselmis chuii, Strain PLY429" /LENGTH=34 /DNA_ID= /DNA_START= /DNA_END= /DNA_ORIENTATION=